jgi:hypothetical protein
MDTKIKHSGPGRPVKPAPRGRKRIQVSMILNAKIKTRVDKEARDSGRTFSQTGEWLIERALSLDDVLRSMKRSFSSVDRENFEMEMIRRGYTKLLGSRHGPVVWLPPEAPVERSGFIAWTEEEQPK